MEHEAKPAFSYRRWSALVWGWSVSASTVQLDFKCYARKHGNCNISWKWEKRQMNRLMRRMAKRDPENAPKRRQTEGWYS